MIRLSWLLLFLILSIYSKAQCKQSFVYECATKTQGQIFLKEYNAKFTTKTTQKFKVVLNKGYTYSLRVCNPVDENKGTKLKINTMLTLHDSNFKIIASTTETPSFEYICDKTDVYWIQIRPLNPDTQCAVGILSVNKPN